MIEVDVVGKWSHIIAMDTLVTFAFIVAAFFALLGMNRSASIKVGATIYAISYLISYYFSTIETQALGYFVTDAYYLNFIYYDLITLCVLLTTILVFKLGHDKSVYIVYLLSIINISSNYTMHYLAFEMKHRAHWFYEIYPFMINTATLLIAFVFLFSVKRYEEDNLLAES